MVHLIESVRAGRQALAQLPHAEPSLPKAHVERRTRRARARPSGLLLTPTHEPRTRYLRMPSGEEVRADDALFPVGWVQAQVERLRSRSAKASTEVLEK